MRIFPPLRGIPEGPFGNLSNHWNTFGNFIPFLPFVCMVPLRADGTNACYGRTIGTKTTASLANHILTWISAKSFTSRTQDVVGTDTKYRFTTRFLSTKPNGYNKDSSSTTRTILSVPCKTRVPIFHCR